MADATETADEANRLYWESDYSVADIAERLDLSRRALYDLIRPLPAGLPCPECNAPLGYANRSARDSARVSCAKCGAEAADAEAETEAATGAGAIPAARRRRETAQAAPARSRSSSDKPAVVRRRAAAVSVNDAERAGRRDRAVGLGAVALLGAVLGAAVTLLATRD